MKNMRIGLILCILFNFNNVSAYDITGFVQWTRISNLSFPVSGVIDNVAVKAGQTVIADELLVELDKRLFDISVRKAKAVVTGMKPLYDEQKREFERASELYERTVSSDHELQQAKIAYNDANADYQIARENLKQAGILSEYSQLKAPMDGILLDVSARKGMYVSTTFQQKPLISIAELSSLSVVAETNVNDAFNIPVDTELNLNINGKNYKGKLYSRVPVKDKLAYQLTFSFINLPDWKTVMGRNVVIELP